MPALFIVWSEDFNTGISIIDEQHRGLVSLINSFFFHRADRDKDILLILVPTMEMFKSYAKINFLTLKKMMRESNYLELEKYEEIHRKMLHNIEVVDRKTRMRRDVDGLLDYLRSYWLDHVKGKSHDYIELFRKYYQDDHPAHSDAKAS